MSRARQPGAQIKVARRRRGKRIYAEVGGKEVSRVELIPTRVRVGAVGELQMAGIGGVGTAREFRRQGLARRVFRRTMQEIKQDGYSCSGMFTGTGIVAHRLYRRFGFVDIGVSRHPCKLLDPRAVIVRTLSQLAAERELSDWRGVIRVHLRPSAPVCVRVREGKTEALRRAPKRVDLSVSMADTVFHLLSWGRVTFEYADTAGLLEWSGDREAWQRLAAAFVAQRLGVREGG